MLAYPYFYNIPIHWYKLLIGIGAFSNSDHLQMQGEQRNDGKKDLEAVYKTKLKVLVYDIKVLTCAESYLKKAQVPGWASAVL